MSDSLYYTEKKSHYLELASLHYVGEILSQAKKVTKKKKAKNRISHKNENISILFAFFLDLRSAMSHALLQSSFLHTRSNSFFALFRSNSPSNKSTYRSHQRSLSSSRKKVLWLNNFQFVFITLIHQHEIPAELESHQRQLYVDFSLNFGRLYTDLTRNPFFFFSKIYHQMNTLQLLILRAFKCAHVVVGRRSVDDELTFLMDFTIGFDRRWNFFEFAGKSQMSWDTFTLCWRNLNSRMSIKSLLKLIIWILYLFELLIFLL